MNSVIKYLERTVEKFPDRTAVEDESGALTYRELLSESKAVASAILACAGNNAPAAVLLPKCRQCLPAFMGILYSGRPYAPVNYTEPIARIKATVQNMAPSVILTDEPGAKRLEEAGMAGCTILLYDAIKDTPPETERLQEALDRVVDTDPAYIIHTSGSTGTPKGVTIPHRGVVNFASWAVKKFHITEQTVIGLQTAFHFDASVLDVYACLFTGAKLVIIPDVLFLYPKKVPGYVEEHGINFLFWVPTVMTSLANNGALSPNGMPAVKTIAFVGEVMPTKTLNAWRRKMPDRLYANLYGPTEATCACTCYVVDRVFDDSEPLPVGRPIDNMRLILLDEEGNKAPPGAQGEIGILGIGLSLGYYNAPEQTAAAFVQNPQNGRYLERVYKTGDLGRFDEEGNLLFLGRKDSQIKLRGNRIELGDVEAAARLVDGVKNACAFFDAEREKIVLFLESEGEFTLRKFNMQLGARLPKYMLPGALFCLEELPLTANRKIDRKKLKTDYMESKN